ncbi:hypothetical protein EC968_003274 [Mortierella alpina]|nr:hypothetical protein EC968_003274 [Mortierella alpina]
MALKSPTFSRKVSPAPIPGGYHDKAIRDSSSDEGCGCKAGSITGERRPKISSVDARLGQVEVPVPCMLRLHQERIKAVAQKLLAHIKERLDNQLRLESALWDTDALLTWYEAEIARDWEAKFVDLRQNVRALQVGSQP